MRQAQHLAVKLLRLGDVLDRPRDLPDLTEANGCVHVERSPAECASLGSAEPLSQLLPIVHSELRDDVRYMELDGVDTDSAPVRDRAVSHAMLHRMRDAPLSGRKHVIVTRPTSAAACGRACGAAWGGHEVILAPRYTIFPPQEAFQV